MSRYESAGTWFEKRSLMIEPVTRIVCPVCQRAGSVFHVKGQAVTWINYNQTADRASRTIVTKISAVCVCGTSFRLEYVK